MNKREHDRILREKSVVFHGLRGSGEESVDELRTLVVKLFLKYKVKIPNIANVYYARSRSVRLSPIIVVLDSVFAAREVLGSFSRRQLEDDVVVEAKLEGKELRNRAHAKGVSKGSISSQSTISGSADNTKRAKKDSQHIDKNSGSAVDLRNIPFPQYGPLPPHFYPFYPPGFGGFGGPGGRGGYGGHGGYGC